MLETRHRFDFLMPILLVIIMVAIATSCSLLPVEEEELAPPLMQPAKIEYKTEPAARGDLVQQLRLSGTLVPEAQESLSFAGQGGRLKEKYVRMGQLVKEGDLIAELETGDLDYEIAMQEIELEKTQLSLSQIRAAGADRYAVKRAQLELQQQEMRLTRLQKQLAAAQVLAPFDGEITYIISTSIGEYIPALQIIAKVADVSQLVLVTTSDKSSELPIGAEVSLEFQKNEYRGEIVANPSSLFNDPDERLRKAAIIELPDGLPDKATMGSDFRITYVQDSREDVIILPRKQINLMSGRRYVNVLVDGIRTEQDVEIGLMTDTEAEIVKGLDEGDMVIVN